MGRAHVNPEFDCPHYSEENQEKEFSELGSGGFDVVTTDMDLEISQATRCTTTHGEYDVSPDAMRPIVVPEVIRLPNLPYPTNYMRSPSTG